MKLTIGMKVYCDLHSKAQKHTVTHLFEERDSLA